MHSVDFVLCTCGLQECKGNVYFKVNRGEQQFSMDKILQNFTGACPGLYPTAPKTSQVEVFLFPVITSKIHYDGLSSCFDMVFLPFMPLDCFYKQRVSNSYMLW